MAGPRRSDGDGGGVDGGWDDPATGEPGGPSGRYTLVRKRAQAAAQTLVQPEPTPAGALANAPPAAPAPSAIPGPVLASLPTMPPTSEVTPTIPVSSMLAPAASEAPPEIRVTPHVLPEVLDPSFVMLREPTSPRAAAWRVLRHDLQEKGSRRLLLVTSARRGEGKTFAALNLALSLCECGRARVLLVEANLEAPALARLFGFVPPWCFAEQLLAHRSQPAMPWSVVAPIQPWLHVAAIRPDAPPAQLTDLPACQQGFAKLRRADYDYVIIDGPRLLGRADANLLADQVDGVIVVTRAPRSRARDLRRAIRQLGARKPIGVIHLE